VTLRKHFVSKNMQKILREIAKNVPLNLTHEIVVPICHMSESSVGHDGITF